MTTALPVNEECGFTGATAFCELWHPERRDAHATTGTITAAELFPRRPDLAGKIEPADAGEVNVKQHEIDVGIRRRICEGAEGFHVNEQDDGGEGVHQELEQDPVVPEQAPRGAQSHDEPGQQL